MQVSKKLLLLFVFILIGLNVYSNSVYHLRDNVTLFSDVYLTNETHTIQEGSLIVFSRTEVKTTIKIQILNKNGEIILEGYCKSKIYLIDAHISATKTESKYILRRTRLTPPKKPIRNVNGRGSLDKWY